MVNLCRDEVTHVLKHKIDQVFGSSFSTHGLGGVLTCGVTGMGAGLSHSPVCEVRLPPTLDAMACQLAAARATATRAACPWHCAYCGAA